MPDNATRLPRTDELEGGPVVFLGIVLLRRWRTLFTFMIIGAIVGAASWLALPMRYVARAVLVEVPDGSTTRSQLMLSQLPSALAANLGGGGRGAERLIGTIMKSRTLADTVANRLARRGGPFDGLDKQIRNIASKSEVHRLDDGSIEIRVTSPNARLAQAVANQFADATNRIAAELTNTAVLQRQEFLEVQLAPALARLERSERDMVRFAKGRNVPDIEGQAEQTVKAAAELQQQVLGAEVQLAQLRRTATADNPEFRAAVNRLETLRRQLHETTSGRVGAGDLFLSLQESPELRIESTRLLREYTKNEQIYLSLVGALAQAQLDARSEVALVGVLDRAVLPSEPMSTSPLLLALAGLLLGTVVGVSGVVGQEALRAARHKPLLTSLFLAWDEFKADVASSLSGLRQARKPEAKHEAACVEESEPAPGTSSTGACT